MIRFSCRSAPKNRVERIYFYKPHVLKKCAISEKKSLSVSENFWYHVHLNCLIASTIIIMSEKPRCSSHQVIQP